jgi:hypothetical protein
VAWAVCRSVEKALIVYPPPASLFLTNRLFFVDYCGTISSVYSPILQSWINKGYLVLNAMGCVGVPKCLATYLEEHGYNITWAFKATLNRVKSETLEK